MKKGAKDFLEANFVWLWIYLVSSMMKRCWWMKWQDAEDAAQEVLILSWLHFDFDRLHEKPHEEVAKMFLGYLRCCIRSVISRQWKQLHNDHRLREIPDWNFRPLRMADQRIHDALEALPEKSRELLDALFYQDRTMDDLYEEISRRERGKLNRRAFNERIRRILFSVKEKLESKETTSV